MIDSTTPASAPAIAAKGAAAASAADDVSFGRSGERLTRDEAFGLVRRAVETLGDGVASRASAVRQKMFDLLGRDSESLERRMFDRILRDAHDSNVVDLRRRGDDFEVSLVAAGEQTMADQLTKAAAVNAPPPPASAGQPQPRGMGPRSAPGRGGRPGRPAPGELPPELLSLGVFNVPSPATAAPTVEAAPVADASTKEKPKKRGRGKAETPAPDSVATEKKPARARAAKPVAEGDDGAPVKARRTRAKRVTADA